MTNNYFFYLKNIFINPKRAANGILVEKKLVQKYPRTYSGKRRLCPIFNINQRLRRIDYLTSMNWKKKNELGQNR